MELNELLKMISSIPQRKSKCRGNLRLKVLLKTTYDYARSSWIDGQFGKPQKLQALLKNSAFNHSSALSSDDSSISFGNEVAFCLEEQSTLQRSEQPMDDTSANEMCDDVLRSDLSLEEEDDESESSTKRDETKENLPELQKVMRKLLKNCNMLIEINDLSRSSIPDYHLNLRKLKRIIHLSRIARVHLERDYENQDFGQQKINRKTLKLIRYLLKQCKTLLKVNYNSKVDHHKLKRIIRKLKKFESCAEKIIAYERECEKAKDELDGVRHVDRKEKEVFNECQFSLKKDQTNSNSNFSFKQVPCPKHIKFSEEISSNSQLSETNKITRKRAREEDFCDRKAKYRRLVTYFRFRRRMNTSNCNNFS